MLDPEPEALDPTEIDEVRTSLDEMARGEVTDWESHSAAVRKRFGL
jgi:hypothetical protein